jgi:DNA-binding NtrC family response regulator
LGDLSLGAQATLLRVLQEHVIERIGGRRAIPIDVRVIAATNKDLGEAMSHGSFRADLYYRLKVIHISMPPLRAMREDVALLAGHFLEQFARELGKGPLELMPEAIQSMENYAWPGNVRQLAHEVKRLVVLAHSPRIGAAELSQEIQLASQPVPQAHHPSPQRPSLKAAVEELEQHMLQEALMASGYNQVQAARRLGLSRQGLIKKLKRYCIVPRPSAP